MTTPDPTIALVAQARRGERAAHDALFLRHGARLLVYISFRMEEPLRRVAEPEDVLQEVYLTAFREVGRFEGGEPGDFYRWLKGIARNHLRNLRRVALARKRTAERPLPSGTGAPGAPVETDTPSRAVARSEEFQSLLRKVNALDPRYRAVLFLRYYEGLTAPDIARTLRITPDAVYQRLHRALAQMRAAT